MKLVFKQFVRYFANSIYLQFTLLSFLFSYKLLYSYSALYLILMLAINIVGLGLNKESSNRSFFISIIYIVNMIIMFLQYLTINGFSYYKKWFTISKTALIKEVAPFLDLLNYIILFMWILSVLIFTLKMIVYISIKNKRNTNFYTWLFIYSMSLFFYLFNRIFQESNNWSYFMAIASFLLLVFDYNIFVSAFSKTGNNKINSKYGEQLSLKIKKKFARIKLIISASSILAIIVVVTKDSLILLYNKVFHKNFNENIMEKDKLFLYMLILIFMLYFLVACILVYIGAKSFKVSRVMKQKNLKGPKNKSKIWKTTWNINQRLKEIPFLEDIVIFYELISSDKEQGKRT